VKDFRFREEVLSKLLYLGPGSIIRLAPPPERAQPGAGDLMPELAECRKIGGHGVVVKEAFDHLRQPSPLFGDRPVHLPPQLLLDLLEFGPHTVVPGFPLEQKCAPAAAAADMGEPQEIEGFRFAKPAPLAVCRSEAAELDQTGFVRMELQSELLEPSSHRIEKTASVVFMLKAQHHIIGVAHDDYVAGGLVPSPALGPEIENVVQVDVGKQRRYYRTLPGSPVTDRHGPVFQDTRLKPFLDQTDDALVANPMFHKSDQPFPADRPEK